ncbi:SAM-dependent methyltransferase [Ectothiorhodospiraceae bacterium BW-2]|nr:SAM-dependent methyltransferase [Ectothiorhodospiraceae bacterium BW-2]
MSTPHQQRPRSERALQHWYLTPTGRLWLEQEQQLLAERLSHHFGYLLLQLGSPLLFDTCRHSPIPKRLLLTEQWQQFTSLVGHYHHLPVASDSIDLVILGHLLQFNDHPHAILREVERILRPEGAVIILGFQPLRLWRINHFIHQHHPSQRGAELIASLRLFDWLRLLGLKIDYRHDYLPASPVALPRWKSPLQRLNRAFNGGYMVSAIKRVIPLSIVRPKWRQPALLDIGLRGSQIEQPNRTCRKIE